VICRLAEQDQELWDGTKREDTLGLLCSWRLGSQTNVKMITTAAKP
jgi:hypothetical protein